MQRLWLAFGVLTLSISLAGCGGSPAGLQIQLTPSAPTLAINSSVQITAQTSPPVSNSGSTLTWQVGGYSGQCTEGETDTSTAPPIPGCYNGYIAYAFTSGSPITSIYYFSPSATGTYQISVFGQITNSSGGISNQGTATANVTVTNVIPQ